MAFNILPPSKAGQSQYEQAPLPNNSERPDRKWTSINQTFENTTDQITFVIGPSQTEFKVYRDNALNSSEILSRFFTNPNSSESQTQTLKLPQTRPAAFQLWIQYIYSPIQSNGMRLFPAQIYAQYSLSSPPTDEEGQGIYEALFGLWYLADYLIMPHLQNETVVAILDALSYLGALPHWECLDEIDGDQESDSGRPLRNLLIDLWAMEADFESYEAGFARLSSAVLARLLARRSILQSKGAFVEDYEVVENERSRG